LGGTYWVQVFDQTNNGFGVAATGSGGWASAVSVSVVDGSSSYATTFAVSYRNGYGNLQIQLWKYILA
jgi:hypothetical protein